MWSLGRETRPNLIEPAPAPIVVQARERQPAVPPASESEPMSGPATSAPEPTPVASIAPLPLAMPAEPGVTPRRTIGPDVPSTPAAPAPMIAPALAPATPAPGPLPRPSPPAAESIAKRINVNTATQAELELLPRVGPALAKRIMDHRAKHGPFKRIADLDAVSGIGPKTLEKLAPLVTVE